jgi:hypothetical protein
LVAIAGLAPDARGDIYVSGSFRWVQGVQGAALRHYGNTSDLTIGYVRDSGRLEWAAGGLVEGWFGHAPFGMGPGAANAYVSPGLEAAVSWRDGAWQIGPRIAVAASGWSNANDNFGSRRTGVPPVITVGVRARSHAWSFALDVIRAESPTPDAPSPDDQGGTSVAFGIGYRLR